MLHRSVATYPHDVFLNSQALDGLMDFEAWVETYDQLQRTRFPHCRSDDGHDTVTVGSTEARISTAVCDGSRWAEALWQHGGRVYSLRVGEMPGAGQPIDPRQEIEAWLGRITLPIMRP